MFDHVTARRCVFFPTIFPTIQTHILWVNRHWQRWLVAPPVPHYIVHVNRSVRTPVRPSGVRRRAKISASTPSVIAYCESSWIRATSSAEQSSSPIDLLATLAGNRTLAKTRTILTENRHEYMCINYIWPRWSRVNALLISFDAQTLCRLFAAMMMNWCRRHWINTVAQSAGLIRLRSASKTANTKLYRHRLSRVFVWIKLRSIGVFGKWLRRLCLYVWNMIYGNYQTVQECNIFYYAHAAIIFVYGLGSMLIRSSMHSFGTIERFERFASPMFVIRSRCLDALNLWVFDHARIFNTTGMYEWWWSNGIRTQNRWRGTDLFLNCIFLKHRVRIILIKL